MTIEATEPTVANLAYDRWTIQSIWQSGDGLANFGQSEEPPIRMTVTLVKYRLRDDGVSERSPFPADRITVTVPDVYARMAVNEVTETGFQAFVAAVVEVATEQGLL